MMLIRRRILNERGAADLKKELLLNCSLIKDVKLDLDLQM